MIDNEFGACLPPFLFCLRALGRNPALTCDGLASALLHLHAPPSRAVRFMATPELLARVVSAFPTLLADTPDVKAARRNVMHKNGDVDEALLQEARRCLLAFKTLGVVVANVMKRDLGKRDPLPSTAASFDATTDQTT